MKKCPKTNNGEHLPEKEVVYILPNFIPAWSGFYTCRACKMYLADVDDRPPRKEKK